jgi:hypothetical protein
VADAGQRDRREQAYRRGGLALVILFLVGSGVAGALLSAVGEHDIRAMPTVPIVVCAWFVTAVLAVLGVWMRTRGVQKLRS